MPAENSILLTTDLSPASDKVAKVACDLATALGSKLLALHVLSEEKMKDIQGIRPESAYVDVVMDNLSRDVAAQLERVTDDQPFKHDEKVVLGEPGQEILRVLGKQPFDYVVVGVRNRSRVGKLLLGSVAQEVLLNSTYTVVAVPCELEERPNTSARS